MTTFHALDTLRILPEIVLAAFAVIIMVLEPFIGGASKKLLGWLALLGILAAGGTTAQLNFRPWPGMGPAFGGSVAADDFSCYFIYLFLLVSALVILGSMNYLERDHAQHGEFYALVLMGTVGMCFMASSTDLIMIFLGLEISSISIDQHDQHLRRDRFGHQGTRVESLYPDYLAFAKPVVAQSAGFDGLSA